MGFCGQVEAADQGLGEGGQDRCQQRFRDPTVHLAHCADQIGLQEEYVYRSFEQVDFQHH